MEYHLTTTFSGDGTDQQHVLLFLYQHAFLSRYFVFP